MSARSRPCASVSYHFAVIATHVAKYFQTHADVIAAPVVAGFRPTDAWTLGRGVLAMTPEDAEDVSVFRIDEPQVVARLRDGGHIFLGEDVERRPNPALPCGIFGWPEEGAQQVGRVVHGKPLVMLFGRATIPPDSRASDIFLEWPEADDVPELSGISGSPLWSVSKPSGGWHPSKEIKLIGVQHTICRGEWIKGTGWDVVDRLIGKLTER